MYVRKFQAVFVVAAALLLAALPTSAAVNFPEKPIILVSQASPGSSMDLFSRMIAKLAPKYLHQTIVVEDKVGADGGVAMEYLLSQPADGYTLDVITRSFATTLDTDLKGKFSSNQFDFVSCLVGDSYVLSVSSDSPYKTLRGLLSAAKTTPITVAGFGSQSAEALFLRQLASESGTKLVWVPFGGGAAATPAVLGGHVVAALNHPGDVKSFVESGKLRVLAVSDATAAHLFPGAVTFQSLGFPDLTVLHYRGIIAKAGTPPDVIAALDRFFNQVARDPEFIAYMKNVNVAPYLRDSNAFTKLVTGDLESMQKQLQAH